MTSTYGLAFGMMAMTPALFASAGYVLVSRQGTGDGKGRGCND